MLPFLDKKASVGTIIQQRGKSDLVGANSEVEAPDSEMDPALKACAEDILRAIDSKSVMDLVSALRAFNEICEYSEGEE